MWLPGIGSEVATSITNTSTSRGLATSTVAVSPGRALSSVVAREESFGATGCVVRAGGVCRFTWAYSYWGLWFLFQSGECVAMTDSSILHYQNVDKHEVSGELS